MYKRQAEGYWCDLGSLQSYLKCNMDALSGKAGIQFKSSSPIGSANIIQPSYIGKNVECDDCTIGPYAVIGDNVKISKNSRIEKSVVPVSYTHLLSGSYPFSTSAS